MVARVLFIVCYCLNLFILVSKALTGFTLYRVLSKAYVYDRISRCVRTFSCFGGFNFSILFLMFITYTPRLLSGGRNFGVRELVGL